MKHLLRCAAVVMCAHAAQAQPLTQFTFTFPDHAPYSAGHWRTWGDDVDGLVALIGNGHYQLHGPPCAGTWRPASALLPGAPLLATMSVGPLPDDVVIRVVPGGQSIQRGGNETWLCQ